MPGVGPINDDVPGAGHLDQHEDCLHSDLSFQIKLSEFPIGPGQVQKAQNAMSNCLFAFGPYISPITNVLLTDLGLSIPLSFIDKCVSTSVDSTIY